MIGQQAINRRLSRAGHNRSVLAVAVMVIASSGLLLSVFPGNAIAAGPPYSITDPGGGDCSQIGTWYAGTKTCTLSQDITISGNIDAIIIGSNDIVLDGAGFTISGSDTGTGVLVSGRSGVQVKNLNANHLIFGIYNLGSSNGVISYNNLSNNVDGIYIVDTSSSTVSHNVVSASSYDQIRIGGTSSWNIIDANNVQNSSADAGIEINSNSNTVSNNLISNNNTSGKAAIYITGSTNSVFNNTVSNNHRGLSFWSSASGNTIYNNNFLGNATQAQGTGTGNSFNLPAPTGGNYWDNHATTTQGCDNADNDRFCDAPYTPPGSVTDNLPLARRSYYFTWYDQLSAGAQNWILMANPIETASEDAWFDLSIAGDVKTLPSSTPAGLPGQVISLGGITPTFPGVMDGPVDVGYHARMQQMVSQRTLWGDSLEEVTGTDAARLSDHYYWTWYDMLSPGFKNWILIGNPSATEIVTATVSFRDVGSGLNVTETHDIAAGGRWTPTYPGKMGGPVEVKATVVNGTWSNPPDRRDVIASQRVLTNGDTAFNEVPGIPAEELTDRYVWTWYDQQSAGAQDWILIANPPDSGFNMDYSIFIHGQGIPGGTDMAPGATAAVMIPGMMDGPVEVATVRHNSGTPLNAIVSQRSIWGPSFEEVPGMPYSSLTSRYFWTWYDQQSAGVTNWVLLANPDDGNAIHYEVTIGGQIPAGGCGSGTLAASEMKSCTFPGVMGGPVKVQAWNLLKTGDKNIIASQRVLWKGYFNEVMGTALS